MYSSSCSLTKLLTLVHFVAIQLLCMCSASSLNLTNTYLHHKCLDNQGYYKAGSAYEKELKDFIQDISTTTFRDGFLQVRGAYKHVTSTILYQCRGDSYRDKCRPCYNAATSELLTRCPRNKAGIIWFDQCFVEVTNIPVGDATRKVDYENIFSLHNPKKVSGDARLFKKETLALLRNLTLIANDKNNKDDRRMTLYAAGEKSLKTKTIYAMVQCTRFFFMPTKCNVCLETIIRKHFPKCCDGMQGGRVLSTSCNFRYELYPFLRINKTG